MTKDRFLIIGNLLETDQYLMLITDFTWWSDNQQQIDSWFENNKEISPLQQGLLLDFPNRAAALLFLLKWS